MNKQIKEIVEKFNDSWLNNDLTLLNEILHPDVVFMAPDMKSGMQGREACIGTIAGYLSQAVTHRFESKIESLHMIDLTAWLTLGYTVQYKLNNKVYKERGVEVWGMIKEKEKWFLGWRCLVKNETIK